MFLYLATIYNILYIPLYLAFPSYSYNGSFLTIEILNICIYFINFLLEVKRLFRSAGKEEEFFSIKNNKLMKEVKLNFSNFKAFLPFLPYCVYLLLITLPMSLIFEYSGAEDRRKSLILIFIQLIRLGYISIIYSIFQPLKRRNVALANIIAILYSYLLLAHVIACMFITVGRFESDYNKMWFRKLPSPQV